MTARCFIFCFNVL